MVYSYKFLELTLSNRLSVYMSGMSTNPSSYFAQVPFVLARSAASKFLLYNNFTIFEES